MEDDVGFGEDPNDQFHRTEAISAVVDQGFFGEEEEDDDFEDLYNDVNVGESFLRSMKKSEDLGVINEVQVAENFSVHMAVNETHPQVPLKGASDTAIARVGELVSNMERDEGVSGAQLHSARVIEGYQQNMGFGGQGIGGNGSVEVAGGTGLISESGKQLVIKRADFLDEHLASKNVSSQGGGLKPHAPSPVPSGADVAGPVGIVGSLGNGALTKHGGGNASGADVNVRNGYGNVGAGGGAPVIETGGVQGAGGAMGQGTMLFVGDLHWWTTDAELEAESCKYGIVKEVRFFDEKASGKSKGYCQVEFYDSAAGAACKEGMNGHVFNGRPCVVSHASPFTIKRMGEAQMNRNQSTPLATAPPVRRVNADVPGRPGGSNMVSGGNYQGSGDNTRGYMRNWGRTNSQGMGSRGPVAPMRNRPGPGGRVMMGNGGMPFGHGMGSAPPLLPHQTMMGPGFDPTFGGPMARMGNYGGFPGGMNHPPFSGMMPSFPPVGNIGLPGVAPHVNPAFFGRGGMPMGNMGMMPSAAVDGPNAGMWGDHNMGAWAGEDHGGGVGESSYVEEAISDHQYGEGSHDRGPWPTPKKDRPSEREWSGSSDRKYRDDKESEYNRDIVNDNGLSERGHPDERDVGRDKERDHERDRERSRDHERTYVRERDQDRERDRDRQQEDKDQFAGHHRHRERGQEYEDEWDRGRSSRTHRKSRLSNGEELRVRSRDAEYGKRRRSYN